MTSRFLSAVVASSLAVLASDALVSTHVVSRTAEAAGVNVATRAGADEGRAPRNAAEFDVMFQQIKNWGRWGADDQLGSANLVTPAKRKQAAALVKTG